MPARNKSENANIILPQRIIDVEVVMDYEQNVKLEC